MGSQGLITGSRSRPARLVDSYPLEETASVDLPIRTLRDSAPLAPAHPHARAGPGIELGGSVAVAKGDLERPVAADERDKVVAVLVGLR